MEIIYRAKDGKEFTNEKDCLIYENHLDGVRMWCRNGGCCSRTNETSKAFVLYLKDEQANRAFFEMARKQNDGGVMGIVEGEDHGLFMWNEWEGIYCYISNEDLIALAAAADDLRAEGLL
jgi:uncharacterized protein involved in tellurium resistance